MEDERGRPPRSTSSTTTSRGCIKTTRGPWLVRRQGRGGVTRTSYRRPSDTERETNRQREKRRRAVASRIFSCLKRHGNFDLPKHPDANDVLVALCHEAGWLVGADGTIQRAAQGTSAGSLTKSADGPEHDHHAGFGFWQREPPAPANNQTFGGEAEAVRRPEEQCPPVLLDLTLRLG